MATTNSSTSVSAQRSESPIPTFGILSPAECENILRKHNVGRLAYALHDRVNVTPVHYKYADGWLYGRSAPGGKLLIILRNRWIAFEVDENDGLFDWRSVVLHGALYVIDPDRSPKERAVYDRAIEVLRELAPSGLYEADHVPFRNLLFRIHASEVTGRFAVSYGGSAATISQPQAADSANAEADESLRNVVLAAISPFTEGDNSSVHVDVHDSVVVLGGRVSDARTRATIEGAIVHLPGVRALVQQLETAGAGVAELAPAEIAQRAITAMNETPLPDGSNITVVVDHNWLRLEGYVSSAKARVEIRRRLENISGARGFVDRLVIEPAG